MAPLLAMVLGAAPSRATSIVAVAPDGSKVYVANGGASTVSVIATASNTVIGSPIPVGLDPRGVAVAPDGSKVYVANSGSNTVSVIDTATNTVTGSPISVGKDPGGVAVIPDGSKVYVANLSDGTVSVIATASNTVIDTITVGASPLGVAVTPDGSAAYVANAGSGFGSGTVSVIATATNTVTATIPAGNNPTGGVAVTPDGSKVYVANAGFVSVIATASNTVTNTISYPSFVADFGVAVTPDGSTVYVGGLVIGVGVAVSVINTASNTVIDTIPGIGPGGMAVTPDGSKVYVADGINTVSVVATASNTVIATFTVNFFGNLTLFAAVLPTSRSVQVGNTATAFATIINAGPDNATTCTIAPLASIPASFVFQTTDPTTNALTGTVNTPANIAGGQSQSFVIAVTPTAAFAPTNVTFSFTCANAPSPVGTIVGINTLNLSASAIPVPDIVALAASSDPGYVDIPGATGTGLFAVATVNLGSGALITASANTGAANLPVTLTVCLTNPQSGTCLAAPGSSVTTDIPPNATPTFGVFVTGSAAVANLPGVNRVFVTFTGSGGTLRGETSVAVRTQ
jgi:YVTN family beta-propeller protein